MSETLAILPICAWTQDDNGNWETHCGEMFVFIDGSPSENGFKFCPYCGEALVEKEAKR